MPKMVFFKRGVRASQTFSTQCVYGLEVTACDASALEGLCANLNDRHAGLGGPVKADFGLRRRSAGCEG